MVKKMKNLVGGTFKNKKIAVLGLAFKPNTNDIRESAAINMIDAINKDCGVIKAYDPIANESMKLIFNDILYYNSWQEASLQKYSCLFPRLLSHNLRGYHAL